MRKKLRGCEKADASVFMLYQSAKGEGQFSCRPVRMGSFFLRNSDTQKSLCPPDLDIIEISGATIKAPSGSKAKISDLFIFFGTVSNLINTEAGGYTDKLRRYTTIV